jgi:hypothetical protein
LFYGLHKLRKKERVEKGEISPVTFRNYIKAVKLFYEMSDIAITWRKITRDLPKAKRFDKCELSACR